VVACTASARLKSAKPHHCVSAPGPREIRGGRHPMSAMLGEQSGGGEQ